MDRSAAETVKLDMPPSGEDPFMSAKALAESEAEKRRGSAMLISWKDARAGTCSPDVESCSDCGLEGWELYAVSRGAELKVEVGEDYVFYFKIL